MLKQHAEFFTLALWWGALTAVGFGVVPLLFASLETPQAAGRMAAVLFNALDWLGWVCAALLLLLYWANKPLALASHAWVAIVMVAVAVGASLTSHGLVAPHIVARENLKLWHSLGSLLYLLQWLCVTILLWLRVRAGRAPF